jgi:hypothetical protein
LYVLALVVELKQSGREETTTMNRNHGSEKGEKKRKDTAGALPAAYLVDEMRSGTSPAGLLGLEWLRIAMELGVIS